MLSKYNFDFLKKKDSIPIRILLLTDTHGKHSLLPELPAADLLIFAGDISSLGEEKEISDFDEYLGTLNHIPTKILIPGNHDFFIYNHSSPSKIFKNAQYLLLNETIELYDGKLKIFGSPYCEVTDKIKHYKCYQFKKDQVHLPKIPEGLDILITHAPPYGILDKAYKNKYDVSVKEFVSVGSQHILKELKGLDCPPQICCFGHIHESFGEVKKKISEKAKNSTVFINPSFLKGRSSVFEEKDDTNKPILVTYYV